MADTRVVTIGRITTGVIMLLAMAWSTQGDQFGTIFEAINKIPMVFAPAVTTVFVFGVLWKRGTTRAAMTTFAVGCSIGIVYFILDLPGVGRSLFGYTQEGFHGLVTDPVYGLGIPFMLAGPMLCGLCILTYVTVSLCTAPPRARSSTRSAGIIPWRFSAAGSKALAIPRHHRPAPGDVDNPLCRKPVLLIMNMRQAVMTSPGVIEFGQVPAPQPGSGEVMVRVQRIGVCGSDVHVNKGLHPFTKYPVVQGHEWSGVVESLGEGVKGIAVGAKVTATPQIVCGRCRPCRRGDYNICDSLKVQGFQAPGLRQDFFVTDAEKIVALPETFTFEQGRWSSPRPWPSTAQAGRAI